jgi:8-oxo-dGTP pyrophosphatase MutT (NUDIX family)
MAAGTRATVCTLVFLVKDDRILLAMKKRGFGQGLWNGVGGKLDPGETIEQAAIRECQEEIGVTPLKLEKIAIHTFVAQDGTSDIIANVYLSHKWKGKPIETEEMAPRWFKRADIPYHDMWDDDSLWLPAVLGGKKLLTTFSFDRHNKVTDLQLKVVSTLE